MLGQVIWWSLAYNHTVKAKGQVTTHQFVLLIFFICARPHFIILRMHELWQNYSFDKLLKKCHTQWNLLLLYQNQILHQKQHLTFLHFLMMPCYMKCIRHSWCINCNLILHLQLAKLTSSQKQKTSSQTWWFQLSYTETVMGISLCLSHAFIFFFIHKFVAHASLYPTHY